MIRRSLASFCGLLLVAFYAVGQTPQAPAQMTVIVGQPGGQSGGGGGAPGNCTLWVDGATGSDATSKASNTTESPWATLLRATWGTTDRAGAGSGSEAAAAGDVVCVTGGAYDSTADCFVGGMQVWGTCRFAPLYETVNSGTSGNPIQLVCTGDCTLTCPDCQAPAVGGASNYVEWYADIADGDSWVIPSCYGANGATDLCPGSGYHEFRADTGPVMAGATGVKFEGLVVTLTNMGADDNVPAVRFEGCTGCEIRNSTISDFLMVDGGNHAPCFQIYNSINSIIEHNECSNGSAGFSFKDQTAMTGTNNLVRYNIFSGLVSCGHWSVIQDTSDYGGTYVYQNIFRDGSSVSHYCMDLIETEGANQGFVNNTLYNVPIPAGGFGLNDIFRNWNNVSVTMTHGIYTEAPMPNDSAYSTQHNAYYNYTSNFYQSEAETNRATLAAFVAVHTTQETESPASIDADPLLANVAGGDFRLCTASGVPHASCSGASPAIALGVDILDLDGDMSTTDNIPAGAYVTGSEVIGLNP